METETTPIRAVRVDWLDSKQPVPAWQWVSDLGAPAPARCTSVGFLVGESADAITLAQSLADADDEAQAGGTMTIPRACVLDLAELAPSASSSPCPAPASGPKPRAT